MGLGALATTNRNATAQIATSALPPVAIAITYAKRKQCSVSSFCSCPYVGLG
jgi:hypothetical protein